MSEDSYDIYRSLFRELREVHPQRCDLNADEYAGALAHPATVTAPVTAGGKRTDAPQLVPVEVNHWLNTEFYRERFPAETATDRLLHLTLWPGQGIGDRVGDRLTEISRDGGIVALDGPSVGQWSAETALAQLKAELRGIRFGEPELLGTQTYWACALEHDSLIPSSHPMSSSEAAQYLTRSTLPGGRATGAFLRNELSEDEVNSMYELYEAAYSILGDHPCAQGVTPAEFRQMVLSERDMEKLVFQRDGKVESICLITPDLSTLSWINLEFYQRLYGEALQHRRVNWYPAIATDPGHAGARNAEHLVALMAALYERACNPATILFDTPDINSIFLPPYLEELFNNHPRFTGRFEVIGEHRYYAVELKA